MKRLRSQIGKKPIRYNGVVVRLASPPKGGAELWVIPSARRGGTCDDDSTSQGSCQTSHTAIFGQGDAQQGLGHHNPARRYPVSDEAQGEGIQVELVRGAGIRDRTRQVSWNEFQERPTET